MEKIKVGSWTNHFAKSYSFPMKTTQAKIFRENLSKSIERNKLRIN